MGTLFEELYKLFFDKIEKDSDFFEYNNVFEEEAIELAKTRAKNYLFESITKLTLNCTPDVDFHDYNIDLETFNFILSPIEKDLISSIMREKYFEKDFSTLKAFQNLFAPKDLNSFAPSMERKTFCDMFKDISDENNKFIRNYGARDRVTGKLKTIKFASYSS